MIEDLKLVYQGAAKRTVSTIKAQPLSILLPFGLQLLFIAMAIVNSRLIASLNILGGFIVAIVNAAGLYIAYTHYYSLVINERFFSMYLFYHMINYYLLFYVINFFIL